MVVVAVAGMAIGALAALRALGALRSIAAVRPFAARLARRTLVLGLVGAVGIHLVLVVAVLVHLLVAAATRGLVFEARTILLEHAEIMIRELEVIFGLDAVAGKLRVARHVLVFFEKLGRIAALAIIARVAAVTGHSLGTLSTAAATATALTVVDQTDVPCRTGAITAAPWFLVIPSTEEAVVMSRSFL